MIAQFASRLLHQPAKKPLFGIQGSHNPELICVKWLDWQVSAGMSVVSPIMPTDRRDQCTASNLKPTADTAVHTSFPPSIQRRI